jgi:hypothetical protein
MTWAATGEISAIWCMTGSWFESALRSGESQKPQRSGRNSTLRSTSSGANGLRVLPLCPGCPPGFLDRPALRRG